MEQNTGENIKARSIGRGQQIAIALAKKKELQELRQASLASSEQADVKPRGRAQLLRVIKALQVGSVGSTPILSTSLTTSSSPTDSSSPTASSSSITSSSPIDSLSSCSSSSLNSSKTVIKKFKNVLNEKTSVDFKGASGKEVTGSANYIQLKLEPGRGVFEYEVTYEPDVDSLSVRMKMLNQVLDNSRAKTFDGHCLYLPNLITDTRHEYKCEHPFSKEKILLTIIYKRQKRMEECIHLYNILFKRIMYMLEYKRIGRNFFDNRDTFKIPQHKLEIWPGYVVSVNEYAGGIMLCLDVQHKVLRTQNALQMMREIIEQNRQRYKQLIEKEFIGSVILTKYNNKTYIVNDIIWDATPLSKFVGREGKQLSFEDYYKYQYNLTIEDKDQPMLVHHSSVLISGKIEKEERIIMLVPELSYMTGLKEEMKNDFRVMKNVAEFTRITPNQRMNSLRKFINNVNSNKDVQNVLSDWGLSIEKATIDLEMRILNQEKISFGKGTVLYGTPEADWTSASMKNPVLVNIDLCHWTLIHTASDKRQTMEFLQCLFRCADKMGIQIKNPEIICAKDDRNETYIKILQETIRAGLQIVCIICPTNRDDRYMTIKKICCVKAPIPSQVINSRTLRNPKRLPAITQKIGFQMNCKLGGSLWKLDFPFKNWMICGIDVYHSATHKKSAVGAFVSNTNNSMTRWYSRVCFHANDKELFDHLKLLFMSGLQEYKGIHSTYPENVIIFRDGIGDGQLNTCREIEIEQMLSVIQLLNVPINLIFIVVQKRINTRIFFKGNCSEFSNPPPGTIVDSRITRKYLYDFFLVSQFVKQGTVSPTHYIILYNDTNILPDHIQRLTYKMCHMYYNWTGTIRVPAPCQYAHRLAYLIGQNIRTEHSPELAHKLFYL